MNILLKIDNLPEDVSSINIVLGHKDNKIITTINKNTEVVIPDKIKPTEKAEVVPIKSTKNIIKEKFTQETSSINPLDTKFEKLPPPKEFNLVV